MTQLPAHYPAHVASERHILTLRGFMRPQRGQRRHGPRGAGREKPRLARDLLRVVLAPPGRSGPFEWVPSGCGGRICSVSAQPGGRRGRECAGACGRAGRSRSRDTGDGVRWGGRPRRGPLITSRSLIGTGSSSEMRQSLACLLFGGTVFGGEGCLLVPGGVANG